MKGLREAGEQSPPRYSYSATLIGSLPLSPSIDTVWLGSQTGRLMIHCAHTEMAHKCLKTIEFNDSITCLEYWQNQVFVVVGNSIYIYKRPKESAWDLQNPTVISIGSEGSITCLCQVEGLKLWAGIKNMCYVIDMTTCKLEGHFQVCKNHMVRHMTASGSGVWVSFRHRAMLQMFHTVTKSMLQEIDVQTAFVRIASKHNLQTKLQNISNVHVTSLMVCRGYLWVGTSTGSVLVYRTPNLKIIPIVTGKPYLTTYCHSSAVRVLISTHSISTMAGSRLNWFISQEQEENEQEQEKLCAGTLGASSTLSSRSTTTSHSSGDFSRKASSKSSLSECTLPEVPEHDENMEETFPPLPPPVFSDEPSPAASVTRHNIQKAEDRPPKNADKVSNKEPDSSAAVTDGDKIVSSIYTIIPNGFATASEQNSTLLSKTASKAATVTPDPPPYPYSEEKDEHREKENKETDYSTFRRIPTPTDREKEKEEIDYSTFRRIPTPTYHDDVIDEPETSSYSSFEVNKPPSPYVYPTSIPFGLQNSPSSVHKKTSCSIHKCVTTLDQSMLPSHIPELVQGIDYVLTGGRGLVNLGKKKRTSVHYISVSGNDVSTAEESCIVAYALKQ